MAKKSRLQKDPEPKPDLTPMIDVVFLLIIFFMVVSELSNLDVEEIELPYAGEAEEDERGPDDQRILQINVLDDGLIKVRGNAYTMEPERREQLPWLADFLEIEAAGYEREPQPEGGSGTPPSALRVNIRADARSPFEHVQQVFDACVRNGIYKTSIAATPDDPDQ